MRDLGDLKRKIQLEFVTDENASTCKLEQIIYYTDCRANERIVSSKGRTKGAANFTWRPAMCAISLALVKAHLNSLKCAQNPEQVLVGGTGSIAHSIRNNLRGNERVFGLDRSGASYLWRIIRIRNWHGPETTIEINAAFAPPSNIEIFVDGFQLKTPETLERLAQKLEGTWHNWKKRDRWMHSFKHGRERLGTQHRDLELKAA